MKTNYFKHIFSLILFGANGIIASHIALSSYEIVFLRTMLGSILLFIIFITRKHTFTLFKCKSSLCFLILSGMCMGASWMFLYEAYQQIGVSIATLIYYCGPVFVMLLSPFLFRERLTPTTISGFAIVLAGLVLVNGTNHIYVKSFFGFFCGLMSAFTYAGMVIFNKKAKNITGLENATLQLIVSFLTVAVFMLFKQGFILRIQTTDILPICILGFINTGVGCYLYFDSLGKIPVQTVSICGYLEPLTAILFSMFFLHETMTLSQILGGCFIIGGAFFAEFANHNHSNDTHDNLRNSCK